MSSHIEVKWFDSGRTPKCPPNPDFPDGMDLDGIMPGERACKVDLEYPTARCGVYFIKCNRCMTVMAVSTAGRPDDPRSVRVPCKTVGGPKIGRRHA